MLSLKSVMNQQSECNVMIYSFVYNSYFTLDISIHLYQDFGEDISPKWEEDQNLKGPAVPAPR